MRNERAEDCKLFPWKDADRYKIPARYIHRHSHLLISSEEWGGGGGGWEERRMNKNGMTTKSVWIIKLINCFAVQNGCACIREHPVVPLINNTRKMSTKIAGGGGIGKNHLHSYSYKAKTIWLAVHIFFFCCCVFETGDYITERESVFNWK